MYTGRFAPSPTGPLHAGSLVAALASWLDARAATPTGRWLVRIEDVDTPRCVPGAAGLMLRQLADCGMRPDEPPLYQSTREAAYQEALDTLVEARLAYPCGCSRRDVEQAWLARGVVPARHAELIYPGTCRNGLNGKEPRAWRLRLPDDPLHCTVQWTDRRLGAQIQNVATQVGDFILKRADSLWAYQLAVVVDDAAQGVTHIVRGADLADNTPRQLLLQRALGLPTPRYLHTPLVLGADGEKLSKQNGAMPLATGQPVGLLDEAARVLGLAPRRGPAPADAEAALAGWVPPWRDLYNPAPT